MKRVFEGKILLTLLVIVLISVTSKSFSQTQDTSVSVEELKQRILKLEKFDSSVLKMAVYINDAGSHLKRASNLYFCGLSVSIGGAAMVIGGAVYNANQNYYSRNDGSDIRAIGSIAMLAGFVTQICAWGEIKQAGRSLYH